MTNYQQAYMLMRKLHRELVAGEIDESKLDPIREKLDGLYKKLTSDEMNRLADSSEHLYRMRRPPLMGN